MKLNEQIHYNFIICLFQNKQSVYIRIYLGMPKPSNSEKMMYSDFNEGNSSI